MKFAIVVVCLKSPLLFFLYLSCLLSNQAAAHGAFILCVLVTLCWCFFMSEGVRRVSSFLGAVLLTTRALFFLSKENLMLFLWIEGARYMIALYLLFYGYQVEKISSSWYLILFSFLSRMVFLGTLLRGDLSGTVSSVVCFFILLVFLIHTTNLHIFLSKILLKTLSKTLLKYF